MPFPKARRRALRLRLNRIHRKIAKGEEEIDPRFQSQLLRLNLLE